MAEANLPTTNLCANTTHKQDTLVLDLKINDIQFTSRELDIIAGIVGKRGSKKIAALLSISPKTVENHIHNIKNKIGCNSREGIIDFVEKSEKHALIIEYYSKLRQTTPGFRKYFEIPIERSSKQKNVNNELLDNNGLLKSIPRRKLLLKVTLIFLTISILSLIAFKKLHVQRLNLLTESPIFWNIPRQDHVFVGRGDLLKELQDKLHQSKNKNSNSQSLVVSACSGLGGIGKTQLVLHYVRHTKNRYTLRAWFPSENIDQLNQKYMEFAKMLGWAAGEKKDYINYVKKWLAVHPGWLLIYDNVKDYNEIAPFLPEKGGQVILTTRHRSWPDKFQMLSIDIMTEKEAIVLTKSLIKRDIAKEIEDIKELVRILGCLPLAIAQAGAYIQQNHISISEYLRLYKNYEQTLLLDPTLPEGTNSLPVAITWNVSLAAIAKEAKIQNESLLSQELLTVCSYLTPEKISRQMLLTWFKKAYPNSDSPQIILNKHLSQLWRYSMINYEGDDFVSIHRLVQTVLRHQHKYPINEQRIKYPLTPEWFRILLEAIHETFKQETTALEDEHHKKSLLSHLQVVVEHYDHQAWNDSELLITLSKVLKDIADVFHWYMGSPDKAKPYYERALAIREAYYGKEHVEVAKILTSYGDVLGALGNPEQQRILLERSLKIKEAHYGKNHVNLIKDLESLGAAHWSLKNFQQSKETLERGLLLGEKHYGKDSIEIARILYFLGNACGSLRDLELLKVYMERALSINEAYYGKGHIQTSWPLETLGVAYYGKRGETKKGLNFLMQALSIQEKYYGENHVEVGETLGNLGLLYLKLGELNAAKKSLERSISILENYYGKNHTRLSKKLKHLEEVCKRLNMNDNLYISDLNSANGEHNCN